MNMFITFYIQLILTVSEEKTAPRITLLLPADDLFSFVPNQRGVLDGRSHGAPPGMSVPP